MRTKWSRKAVVKAIQKLNRAGVRLNSHSAKRNHLPLTGAAYRYFGSWEQAIIAAGLDYQSIRVQKKFEEWSKEKIIASIQELYKMGVSLNIKTVQKSHIPLYGAGSRYFGGWGQAIIAAGLDYQTIRRKPGRTSRKWSRDIVIREMQRLIKEGVNLRSSQTSKEYHRLFGAARRYCGGWQKAYLLAGVVLPQKQPKPAKPERKKLWDKEIVLEHIRQLHTKGSKLNSNHVQQYEGKLYQAAGIYWGGWKSAIEAAGLYYDDVRIKERNRPIWSKGRIIALIQERHRLDAPLNSNHIQTKETRLYGAASQCFGGWPQAVIAAGLDYEKLRKVKQRTWTKQVIVHEIIRRKSLGLTIRGGDMEIEDRKLYNAARRHFGKEGWMKARILAGLEPRDPDNRIIWNKTTVCDEIKLLNKNGVSLNTGSLQKSAYAYALAAGCKVFGSWSLAVEAAGLDYSKICKKHLRGFWTKSKILETIKYLEKEGVRLSSKAMQKSGGGLVSAAVIKFGSWSEAVEAAGINYRNHCHVWSTKAWLRRMSASESKSKPN